MVKKKQPKKQELSQPATKSDLAALGNATQRDLEVWGGELTRRLDHIEEKMVTKEDLQEELNSFATKDDLTTAIKKSEERLIFEFKALAEIVMRDVGAVNRDEIESLKDADQKIDERVTVLEHKATAAR